MCLSYAAKSFTSKRGRRLLVVLLFSLGCFFSTLFTWPTSLHRGGGQQRVEPSAARRLPPTPRPSSSHRVESIHPSQSLRLHQSLTPLSEVSTFTQASNDILNGSSLAFSRVRDKPGDPLPFRDVSGGSPLPLRDEPSVQLPFRDGTVIQPSAPCRLALGGRARDEGRWYNFSAPPALPELYVYSAFLDNRMSLLSLQPVLRLVVVSSLLGGEAAPPFLDCLLYFGGPPPAGVDGEVAEGALRTLRVPTDDKPVPIGMGWPMNGVEAMEYILSCPLTYNDSAFVAPRAVALVLRDQTGTRVRTGDNTRTGGAELEAERPRSCVPVEVPARPALKDHLYVCVPVAFGALSPRRLVEWVEMQRLLGVTRVLVYDLALSAPALRVLRYYALKGFVELRRTAHIYLGDPTHYWLHSSPVINDCLYRHMHAFRHVVVIDLDELIVPRTHYTLLSLLADLERAAVELRPGTTPTSYSFTNGYFFLDTPPTEDSASETLTYMRYRRVVVSPPGYASKSVSDPQACVGMHNHFCWAATPAHAGPAYWEVGVAAHDALNRHYKRCHFNATTCAAMRAKAETSHTMDKYAVELAQNVRRALADIYGDGNPGENLGENQP